MSWINNLGGLLGQYVSGAATPPHVDVEQHFDQVSQLAPHSSVADGLSAAFRSSETPPFPSMLANLFGNSNGQQRAGLLNTLLASAGPGALGSLSGLLGGKTQVTPEEAQQIPPETVQQVAQQAEKHDPSIVDRASQFYAQHPGVVKTLGGAALSLILANIASRQTSR